MNVREGMRRLGILLGACGGILGGCLAYSDVRTTWDNYTAHRKFESLMASPTVQKVAKAAREYQNGPWVNHGPSGWSGQLRYQVDGTIRGTATEVPKSGYIIAPSPESHQEAAPGSVVVDPSEVNEWGDPRIPSFDQFKGELQLAERLKSEGGIVVSVNLNEIRRVIVDKAGLVVLVEPLSGEPVQRVDPPSLKAYVVPLLYPVLGFLFPWGVVRVLTWVMSGFFTQRP